MSLRGTVSCKALLVSFALSLGTAAAAEPPHVAAKDEVAAGEYVATIAGCNDCHTAGWPESDGKIPPADRFLGAPIGFTGPWGTSYPTNLRLTVQHMSADEWAQYSHELQALPPMPAMNVRHMSERDRRAIYAYLKSLGPKGQPAPAALPPGETPKTPYIVFVPTMPK